MYFFNLVQVGEVNDNEYMDIDDSYVESGSQVSLKLSGVGNDITSASTLTCLILNLRGWMRKGTKSGIYSMMTMTKAMSMHLMMRARAK